MKDVVFAVCIATAMLGLIYFFAKAEVRKEREMMAKVKADDYTVLVRGHMEEKTMDIHEVESWEIDESGVVVLSRSQHRTVLLNPTAWSVVMVGPTVPPPQKGD